MILTRTLVFVVTLGVSETKISAGSLCCSLKSF